MSQRAQTKNGEWYHIVATWNAEKLEIYVNGKLEGATANTIGGARQRGGLVIGAQPPTGLTTAGMATWDITDNRQGGACGRSLDARSRRGTRSSNRRRSALTAYLLRPRREYHIRGRRSMAVMPPGAGFGDQQTRAIGALKPRGRIEKSGRLSPTLFYYQFEVVFREVFLSGDGVGVEPVFILPLLSSSSAPDRCIA